MEHAIVTDALLTTQQKVQDDPKNQHTTLVRSPDPDQDGDTKGVHKRDETIDNDIPCEYNGRYNTLEGEDSSHAEQDVFDAGSHVTKYGDNTDPTSLMNYSTSFSKTPLPYHGEETSHPPDTDFNGVPIVGLPDSRECTTATEALQITQQGVHSSNQHASQVADPAFNI